MVTAGANLVAILQPISTKVSTGNYRGAVVQEVNQGWTISI